MQRYFVKNFNYDENLKYYTDTFTLSSKDSHHLINVMRKSIGDKVEIVSNNDTFICEIINNDEPVLCKVIEKLMIEQDNMCYVTIAQSLVKEQKMDYILQKSCELGVSEVIPLNVTRSVVKFDKKENKKIERWKNIMASSSEQSKRTTIPLVNNIMNVDDLIKLDYKYKLLCTVNESSINIKRVLSNITLSDTILIVIGPEGGFTNNEEEKLNNNGFISVTFGNRVLRTETASLFILSIINYILER